MKPMHTIIKIAVVSVLALFAIVGVISISKAEETVWYCEMTNNILITDNEFSKQNLSKFKMKVTPEELQFGKGGGKLNNFKLKMSNYFSPTNWEINDSNYNVGFIEGNMGFSGTHF
jgi:hypothetical protein